MYFDCPSAFENLVDEQLQDDLENYSKAVKMYHDWLADEDSSYQPSQNDWEFVQLLAIRECAEQRNLWESAERAGLSQEICSASIMNFDTQDTREARCRKNNRGAYSPYVDRWGGRVRPHRAYVHDD